MTEDIKHRIKFDELKKRYRAVEEENDLLQEKLHRAQKSIKRLRLERTLLLDRIDKSYNDNHNNSANSDSDTGSDLLLHNEHHYHYKHHSNSNKHHSNNTTTNNTTTIIKPPKKKKDPNAPKGPGNVFFLYCRFQRDKIKDENPEENIGDVTKILGLKWKALPKEEKQFYYDTFKREMDEYEEAMKIYKANGGKVCEEEESTTAAVVVAEESSLASSPANTSTITSPDNEHHLQPTITNMLAVDNTMVEEEEEEDF